MSERVFKHADKARMEDLEEVPEETPSSDDAKIVRDIDFILDQIDEVLETNAEEFVRSYVQKGGQ